MLSSEQFGQIRRSCARDPLTVLWQRVLETRGSPPQATIEADVDRALAARTDADDEIDLVALVCEEEVLVKEGPGGGSLIAQALARLPLSPSERAALCEEFGLALNR